MTGIIILSSLENMSMEDSLVFQIGIAVESYQEANFFSKYNIDLDLKMAYEMRDISKYNLSNIDINKKILTLVSLQTYQNRYISQVKTPFVSQDTNDLIMKRLGTVFTPDEIIQVDCDYNLNGIDIKGRCDVLKKGVVWELKFTSELRPEHYLQLAMYLLTMERSKGVLWNVRTNEMYDVSIKVSREEFAKQVYRTITKKI